jgi:hypothetical protein
MKSEKVFWTSILLLAALALGGCAQLATQQKAASPAAEEERKEKPEPYRE